jgi:NDP-sugar pyrophosphorylase family protein
MKMGIIAAGRGERLAQAGIPVPKPLVPIGGKPLIARIIEAGVGLGVASVACVVNELNPAVGDFVRSCGWPLPVDLVVKTTPNSMESLFCLAPYLSGEPFLLSTVDVVFGPGILNTFLSEARALADSDGALAITRYVDDERPLWVAVDDQSRITAMGDAAAGSGYVTAGFYHLAPGAFAEIDAARKRRLNSLRQFLGHLVESGYRLHGVPVGKTVDVDLPADIVAAEDYVRESQAR